LLCRQGGRQNPAYRPEATVQAKFAQQDCSPQLLGSKTPCAARIAATIATS
jgi:hypothetical protein